MLDMLIATVVPLLIALLSGVKKKIIYIIHEHICIYLTSINKREAIITPLTPT